MALLADRVALVTGASRGIGRAIAGAFAREGAKVMLSSRSDAVLGVAETIGRDARALVGDVSDEAQAKALVQGCRRAYGSLDILVNNAGILRSGLLGMVNLGDVRTMFEVNVFSMINLTQYAVRVMAQSANPSVINLASIAGTDGIEGISAYSASKAAVIGFTKAAAKELAPKRIRVNAIAPGFIDTDMAHQVSEEWFAARVRSVRMGRIGTPEEVAGVAVFLASDLASHVTGEVLGVDGGMQV